MFYRLITVLVCSLLIYSAAQPPANALPPPLTCTQTEIDDIDRIYAKMKELASTTPDAEPFPLAPRLADHSLLTESESLQTRCPLSPYIQNRLISTFILLATFADTDEQRFVLHARAYGSYLNLLNEREKDGVVQRDFEKLAQTQTLGDDSFYRDMTLLGVNGAQLEIYHLPEGADCPYPDPRLARNEIQQHEQRLEWLLPLLPDRTVLDTLPTIERLNGLAAACPGTLHEAMRAKSQGLLTLMVHANKIQDPILLNGRDAPDSLTIRLAQQALKAHQDLLKLPVEQDVAQDYRDEVSTIVEQRIAALETFIAKKQSASVAGQEKKKK